MRRERLVLIAASVLSIFSLGIAASVLESMSVASPYDIPQENDGGPSMAIEGVLFQLVASLFELFGIEMSSLGPASAPGSALELLVVVVRALRPLAPPLLGLGVCALLLLLVSRRLPGTNRDTIGALLRHRFLAAEPKSGSESANETWPPAEPDDEVSEAWVAMTTHLEIDDPTARTPAEWADAAIDAGFDDSAVENLTDLFRKVRYDSETSPSERRQRAARELERIECDAE